MTLVGRPPLRIGPRARLLPTLATLLPDDDALHPAVTSAQTFLEGVGYYPAGNRSKYRDTLRRTMASVPAPQTLVNDFINDAQAANPGLNWRREVFLRRVVLPWQSLSNNLLPGDPVRLKAEINWYRLFHDLIADFDVKALHRRQTKALKAAGVPLPQ